MKEKEMNIQIDDIRLFRHVSTFHEHTNRLTITHMDTNTTDRHTDIRKQRQEYSRGTNTKSSLSPQVPRIRHSQPQGNVHQDKEQLLIDILGPLAISQLW